MKFEQIPIIFLFEFLYYNKEVINMKLDSERDIIGLYEEECKNDIGRSSESI